MTQQTQNTSFETNNSSQEKTMFQKAKDFAADNSACKWIKDHKGLLIKISVAAAGVAVAYHYKEQIIEKIDNLSHRVPNVPVGDPSTLTFW